jgi:hypothetical protein
MNLTDRPTGLIDLYPWLDQVNEKLAAEQAAAALIDDAASRVADAVCDSPNLEQCQNDSLTVINELKDREFRNLWSSISDALTKHDLVAVKHNNGSFLQINGRFVTYKSPAVEKERLIIVRLIEGDAASIHIALNNTTSDLGDDAISKLPEPVRAWVKESKALISIYNKNIVAIDDWASKVGSQVCADRHPTPENAPK